MKTIFYILTILFISANFTSCTDDSLAETESLYVDEVVATTGEDGGMTDQDDDDSGN